MPTRTRFSQNKGPLCFKLWPKTLEIIKKGLKILTTRRESAEDSESLIQSLRARK